MRSSLKAIASTCRSLQKEKETTSNVNFYTEIGQSQWLQHIFGVLKGATKVMESLKNGHPCIVHCSDGWDRTPQVCATVQLLMDSHYRTIHGFATLIEKEWCAFGHQFGHRNGGINAANDREFSPIFLQWLDIVFQLISEHPNSFEFNENLLLFLSIHVYSGMFGNFLFNCDKDRLETKFGTIDIWSVVKHNSIYFENLNFQSSEYLDEVLMPSKSISSVLFWRKCYIHSNWFDKASESSLWYNAKVQKEIETKAEILEKLKSRQKTNFAVKYRGTQSFDEALEKGTQIHQDAVLATRRKVVQQCREADRELEAIMPPNCKLNLRVSFVQVAKEKEQGRKFAQYLLEVTQVEPTRNSWTIYRRVSDFYSLNDYLVQHNIVISSPLPAKTWFHSYETEFLSDRMKELNNYCKVLETQSDLFTGKHFLHVRNFLTDGLQLIQA